MMGYEQAPCLRRPLGGELSRSCRWSHPSPRVGGPAVTTVRPWRGSSSWLALWHPLGDAAARAGLLGHDLLAALARLARGRSLGRPAPRALGATGGCRAPGLEPCRLGQRVRTGERGGAESSPNSTGRGKTGTKRHVVVDRRGTPLGVCLSPANRHDSVTLAATLDAVPGVRHGRGRSQRRPKKLHGL